MEFKPFRKRVPAEFQPTCIGKQITFTFQQNGRWKAFSLIKTVTPTNKIGLRTKDVKVYKQRMLEAELTMSRELQRISDVETELEHDKVISLAARFYEDYRFQTETSVSFVHCTEATVAYSRQRAIWRLKMGKQAFGHSMNCVERLKTLDASLKSLIHFSGSTETTT